RAGRLPDALLVLDQREAHVPVTAVTEPDPGADRDARLAREPQRELQRPLVAVRLRDRRPDEHRPARRLDVPAGERQSVAERVAPASVDVADLAGILAGLAEGYRGGD